MPSITGSLISTGPNSFNADFKGRKYSCTVNPALPSWSVPIAVLDYDIFHGEPSTPIEFTGTIGPTSVDLKSTYHDAEVTGQLVPPIDKQYDVTGTFPIELFVKPGSYSTISVYIAFY
jgi:hypothetical protein